MGEKEFGVMKTNIAELLKDCPKGMELDCTMFDNVYFERIDENVNHPIVIRTRIDCKHLTKEGCWTKYADAKCVIFPKGKTTWEGFVPPCKFKDGDILYVDGTEEDDDKQYDYIFIFNKIYNGQVYSYCHYYIPNDDFKFRENEIECLIDDKYPIRFATEEEKQKLFDAIKANGYKWNAETKTLEKLPKFKVGDRIRKKGDYISGFVTLIDSGNFYKVEDDEDGVSYFHVKAQDEWELVPNKFDISTLKAFESRVLVRDFSNDIWRPAVFGGVVPKIDYNDLPFVVVGGCFYGQCIPYEANKELLGTTNDCDEFYKTWEK